MKRISLLMILITAALCGNAQLLWKISGNGLTEPSYIFGTHHLAPATMLDSVKGGNEAFAKAEKVYGEIDMSVMKDMAAMMKIQQATMAPADSTLSKVFSAAELKQIDELIAKTGLGVNAAMLEPVKPAALSNMIAFYLTKQAFPDFTPEQQLDATIQDNARRGGKEVGGLETLDSQVDLLYGGPIARQADDIRDILKDVNTAVESTRLLADAYMAQDINKLYSLITDPKYGFDEEEAQRMVYDRNRAWVEVLSGLLPTATVFIVVGAGHIPGEKGLVKLLRKAGYTVEPVD